MYELYIQNGICERIARSDASFTGALIITNILENFKRQFSRLSSRSSPPRTIPAPKLVGRELHPLSQAVQKISEVCLLSLIHGFGSSIPISLLEIGFVPQKRWDEHGRITEASFVNRNLNDLFIDRSEFDKTLQDLIQQGMLENHCDRQGSGVCRLRLTPSGLQCVREMGVAEFVSLLGLEFMSHIFPRDKNLQVE